LRREKCQTEAERERDTEREREREAERREREREREAERRERERESERMVVEKRDRSVAESVLCKKEPQQNRCERGKKAK
jgi:ATP-dependent RNA helicase DDX23/PRP28